MAERWPAGEGLAQEGRARRAAILVPIGRTCQPEARVGLEGGVRSLLSPGEAAMDAAAHGIAMGGRGGGAEASQPRAWPRAAASTTPGVGGGEGWGWELPAPAHPGEAGSALEPDPKVHRDQSDSRTRDLVTRTPAGPAAEGMWTRKMRRGHQTAVRGTRYRCSRKMTKIFHG